MKYLAALVLFAPALFSQRWSLQYFYDENRQQLNLVDLAFPNAMHGVAAGWIEEPGKKNRPTILMTRDGGSHWELKPLEEQPRSIFFLNESRGWMVTDNNIWTTEEGGLAWRKLSAQKKPDAKLR